MQPVIPPFTPFWASREPTRSPDAARLQALAARYSEEGLAPLGSCISVRHLGRMLTTARGARFSGLALEDLVEVADHDPARGTLLLIGLAEPSIHSSLHFLVLRHRPEIGAVVQLSLPAPSEGPKGPLRTGELPAGSLELAQAALVALRSGPLAHLAGHGWLAVGRDLSEADDRLRAGLAEHGIVPASGRGSDGG